MELSNWTNFASRAVVKLLRISMNACWPVFMRTGYPAIRVTTMMRLQERAENGARVRTRPPAHLADSEHAEQERERHEQRPNVVGGGVEIGETWIRIPTEGPNSVR